MTLFRRRHDMAQAFRNNRELQQFVLTDVIPTGRILGTGSYGSVEEVMYKSRICAGKKVHEILLDMQNQGVVKIVEKYQQECQLMSSLHHPNITQFLGLCFLPDSKLPLLVMERLETNLDDLLEHVPNLPISLKRSVLENVASGLLYLHKRQPSVIHRDLTAKNVLLTSSLVAKITDMGNSRIIDMRPGQMARTLSQLPGTLVYMPPEALDDRHCYGPSLDIFSFGHLALFTITQKFPGDLLPGTYVKPNDTQRVQGRSELERREMYVDMLEAQIGTSHPALVELVKQCLHNAPQQRPSTDELLVRLQSLTEDIEGEHGGTCGIVKLDITSKFLLKMKDSQLTQLQDRHEVELEEKAGQLLAMARELKVKDRQIEELQQQLEDQARQLQEITKRQNEIKVSLKLSLLLNWKQASNMPFGMISYVQSVLVKQTVYVGGGRIVLFPTDNDHIVMTYSIASRQWTKLPPYITRDFTMTVIRNQLVLVGGEWPGGMDGGDKSKVLGVWRADSKKWTHPYPDMPTARAGCSAVAYKEWLVVAGGCGITGGQMMDVEVMNSDTKQWYAGPPTPVAWSEMRTAIVGDTCYFMGGYTEAGSTHLVYGARLPTLIAQYDAKDAQIWKELPPLPTELSAPLAIGRSLLAVGGKVEGRVTVSGIHLYQPDTREWVKVGDLPTPRFRCTCAMISDEELIFVAGGTVGARVDIADISGST